MKQKYISYLILFLFINLGVFAQEKKNTVTKSESIEGLQVFPNPSIGKKVFVTTDSNSNIKEIELFDMLGKKVLSTTLYNTNKEINLSNLNAGVYIIQVKENNATATRKLIIK